VIARNIRVVRKRDYVVRRPAAGNYSVADLDFLTVEFYTSVGPEFADGKTTVNTFGRLSKHNLQQI